MVADKLTIVLVWGITVSKSVIGVILLLLKKGLKILFFVLLPKGF